MITVIHTLCLESLEFQVGQKFGNHHNSTINQGVDTRLVSSMDDMYSPTVELLQTRFMFIEFLDFGKCLWPIVVEYRLIVNIPREERLTKYWSLLMDLVTKIVWLTPECIQIMDKYGLILHLKLSDCYILRMHFQYPRQENHIFGENKYVCHVL